MIYVDDLRGWTGMYAGKDSAQAERVGKRNGHQWCHMLADDADCAELHAFAASIGLKRKWFQRNHYDLTPSRRVLAVQRGAIEVDRYRLVAIIREQRRRAALAPIAEDSKDAPR